jgi:hypothetical protein
MVQPLVQESCGEVSRTIQTETCQSAKRSGLSGAPDRKFGFGHRQLGKRRLDTLELQEVARMSLQVALS